MSIFSEKALPEVPLEDLIRLEAAFVVFVRQIERLGASPVGIEALPQIYRMKQEIQAELDRRCKILTFEREGLD